ncbi:MAG: hypothetical protein L0H93_08330 [Nocardioides sp.]|nr:hypothetical protein [Nocardioides sp.]
MGHRIRFAPGQLDCAIVAWRSRELERGRSQIRDEGQLKMIREVIRARARTPSPMPPLRQRLNYAFVLVVLGGVVLFTLWRAVADEGTRQFLSLCITLLSCSGATGVVYALVWPRGGRLVVVRDVARDQLTVPSWRGMRPLVLLTLLGCVLLAVAVLLAFSQGVITGSGHHESGALLGGVIAVPAVITFLAEGSRTSELVLNSDFVEFRWPFTDELIEWRDVEAIDLVANPRPRIRIRHAFGSLEVIPGPFDSDPRLIVDLLRAVWGSPEVIEDLDMIDVGSLVTQR